MNRDSDKDQKKFHAPKGAERTARSGASDGGKKDGHTGKPAKSGAGKPHPEKNDRFAKTSGDKFAKSTSGKTRDGKFEKHAPGKTRDAKFEKTRSGKPYGQDGGKPHAYDAGKAPQQAKPAEHPQKDAGAKKYEVTARSLEAERERRNNLGERRVRKDQEYREERRDRDNRRAERHEHHDGERENRREHHQHDNRRKEHDAERRGNDRRADSERLWDVQARRDERSVNSRSTRSNARDAALDALREVVRNDAYASQALDRSLSHSSLSAEDRRLAASLFYFAVENRLYIEWALGRLMQTKPEPMVADIMHIAAAQILFMDKIPDHAAVDEAVKQVRAAKREGLSKLVNGVLRSLIRARDAGELVLPEKENDPVEYLSVRYSTSQAAVRRLISAYGAEKTEEIIGYTPKERTLTVRPNAMQIGGEAFEKYLTDEGFQWKHGAVKGAYILSGAGSVAEHDGYRSGLFSVQGESSMLAAMAACARPGMQILDACAAPGGKTCYMAEQMSGSGRVYAWDVHAHRVELIRAAAYRLRLENVRPAEHDATRPMTALELSMDAVLVDAPCSGLGVISDKPDIKYRSNDETFDALLPLQAKILDACAQAVKVGGRLIYSTCTILPEENEMQVQEFLKRHGEFEIDRDVSWLPEALREQAKDGMIQILPSRDGLEGFFIARMRRRSV